MQRNKGKERTVEYIVTIIVNLILLYVFNNLLNWHIYFITPAFNEVLWIINLSIIASIIGNALLLLYHPEWSRHVTKIILNIIAFIVVYFLYKVFPFNFNNSFLNGGLTILLILGMIGLAVAIIVEFVQLITGKPENKWYKF